MREAQVTRQPVRLAFIAGQFAWCGEKSDHIYGFTHRNFNDNVDAYIAYSTSKTRESYTPSFELAKDTP